MAIYRGPGGAGDAVNDASSETRLAVEARDAAIAAQQAAEAAESAAQSAQAAAELAETNAETAETNAETAATSASSAASAAHTYADNAAASASDAADSASAAATSETNAASSASAASTSASNAATSATNAASSASSASTSATNAASSASSASTSASSASSSASAASTSATNAASSASSASTSASTATTQAGIATTKASEAATLATNASNSASSASTSATNAASSASSASTSASNAATSATSASNSATAASSAQTAAESARDATLAAYDNFDDRYLGTKSSDPTVDNDGNALVAGALYFSSTDGAMKVYTGTAWVAAYVSGSGALLAANNLSDVSSVSSARTNLGVTATGSDTTYAYRANNLSDLASASTARTNLGLGTAATTAATDYATAAQGTKADTAYGWGNHASAGYLTTSSAASTYQPLDADLTAIAGLSGTSGLLKKTAANTWSLDTNTYLTSYTETDPIYTASSWYSTTNNASNWNTAYGWGNHASAGYLTSIADGSVTPAKLSTGHPTWDTSGNLTLDNGSADGAQLVLKSSGYSDWNIDNYSGSLRAYYGASEMMRLDSSGNLGIGTTSPATKLQVNDTITIGTADKAIQWLNSGAALADIRADSSNNLIFRNTSSYTERMRIDSSGNVGIGGSNPAAKLDVYKNATVSSTDPFGSNVPTIQGKATSASGKAMLQLTALSSNSAPALAYVEVGAITDYRSYMNSVYSADSGGAGYFSVSQFNPIGGSTTERMRIDSSGNLGIGTSSPARKLDVSGTGDITSRTQTTTAGSYYELDTPASPSDYKTYWGTTNGVRKWGIGNYGTGNDSVLAFYTSTTERMRLSAAGGFSVGTTADPGAGAIYATGNITAYYSDERLKTKIGNIDNALDKVKQIETMVYHANDKAVELGYDASVIEVGVTAQSVQKVQPEVVVPAPVDQQYLTVRYDRLVPLLIEAIKELEAQVAELKAK